MSNAKRRHRRRWYRAQRAALVQRTEAELRSQGYTLSGETGAERIWTRELPRLKGEPRIATAFESEWVEVP